MIDSYIFVQEDAGNNNEYLHKAAALEIFERICDGQTCTMVSAKDGEKPLV